MVPGVQEGALQMQGRRSHGRSSAYLCAVVELASRWVVAPPAARSAPPPA